MPLIALELITDRVEVQKTPVSTMTLELNDWRCRLPPTSSAKSSPLRTRIAICIALRASSQAASWRPTCSPNPSKLSPSTPPPPPIGCVPLTWRSPSNGKPPSDFASPAADVNPSNCFICDPSMDSFPEETEMAAARSGPMAFSTACSTPSSGELAVAPMITTCTPSSSRHSSRNCTAPLRSFRRPSAIIFCSLVSLSATTVSTHSCRRRCSSATLRGSCAAAVACAACAAFMRGVASAGRSGISGPGVDSAPASPPDPRRSGEG
mmetsp:Transcript_46547/g.74407  ORF Transcript_46547/g.74407 Transcript_46547/m.74407 type:complete len:265 (-) Transcript_46547:480-1274(-)